MKMQYDGREYDVRLAGPSSKIVRLISKAKDVESNGADGDEDDIYAELLDCMIVSIDGEPPHEADGEVQWAALFAGMQSFGKLAQKKSGRKKGGRR